MKVKVKERPLECTWAVPIDITGLNDTDKKRIRKVGFKRWLDEVCPRQERRLSALESVGKNKRQ